MPLSINKLLDKQFFIPHYQRGYRWTKQQVLQLLDDIDKFFPREIGTKPGEKTFYCLQPVVVKIIDDETKKKNGLQGEWYEVIDGQQRLTSIFLIIQYINDLWAGRQKKEQFKINYETRKGCMPFLNGIKVNEDNTTVTINKSNIDFYHITMAYQAIRNWELEYKAKNNGRSLDDADFQSKFFANSKIIWYEVSPLERSQALFERLNLGKIPLTNAELTKALFLSSNSFQNIPNETRRIKQIEIARLWDDIEHKLNEPDLKFWSFITNKKRSQFDTKIELILDLISGKTDDEKDPFYTFLKFTEKQQSGNLSDVWSEIEHFYLTLLEWYQNKNHYHKIGYLIAAKPIASFKKIELGQLVKDSMIKTKDAFEEQLDDLIRSSIRFELSEMRYKDDPNELFNVLLLFNIETNRTSEAIAEFYPFKQHKDNLWSLEHIHARNSEGFDRSKKEPWLMWLNLHKPVLEDFLLSMKDTSVRERIVIILDEIEKYNNVQITWQRFSNLFNQVNDIFTNDAESLDKESEGIANMALLSQPDNAALNNAVFEVKRRAIINLDKEGRFIPVCTRRIFMKYYNADGSDIQHYFWSASDRRNYVEELEKTIGSYLTKDHINYSNEDE